MAFSGELRREGDVSDSANVCGAGPLGDRSLPGRPSGQERRSRHKLAKLRRAPEVGRFLRKRQCLRCRTARRSVPTWEAFGEGTQVSPQTGQTQASSGGRAISPKAPMSAVPDRSEIGPYPGSYSGEERGSCDRLTKLRRALGVGRFLRKRQCLRYRTARESQGDVAGRIGDGAGR